MSAVYSIQTPMTEYDEGEPIRLFACATEADAIAILDKIRRFSPREAEGWEIVEQKLTTPADVPDPRVVHDYITYVPIEEWKYGNDPVRRHWFYVWSWQRGYDGWDAFVEPTRHNADFYVNDAFLIQTRGMDEAEFARIHAEDVAAAERRVAAGDWDQSKRDYYANAKSGVEFFDDLLRKLGQ